MFEVRVVVGRDPATGRSLQRSFTVRGDVEQVQARRRELVADYGVAVPMAPAAGVTVAEFAAPVDTGLPPRLEAVDGGRLPVHGPVPRGGSNRFGAAVRG
ncbi:MAG: hypothetical protein ACRDT4_01505 [Micromonosporaceae bacterium]